MRDRWDLTKPSHRYVIGRPELYTFIEVSQNNHISGQRHWGRLQQVRTLLSRRPRPMNSVKVYIKVSNWPVTDADRRESSNRFWRFEGRMVRHREGHLDPRGGDSRRCSCLPEDTRAPAVGGVDSGAERKEIGSGLSGRRRVRALREMCASCAAADHPPDTPSVTAGASAGLLSGRSMLPLSCNKGPLRIL